MTEEDATKAVEQAAEELRREVTIRDKVSRLIGAQKQITDELDRARQELEHGYALDQQRIKNEFASRAMEESKRLNRDCAASLALLADRYQEETAQLDELERKLGGSYR